MVCLMPDEKLIIRDADGHICKPPFSYEKVEVKTDQEKREDMITQGVCELKDKQFWAGLNKRFRDDDKMRIEAGIMSN